MRWMMTAALCVLSTTLAGCGTSSDEAAPTGVSDCQDGVRFEGATYMEVGYIDAASGRAGEAVLGECDDQGPDPAGITFPEDAHTVEVWVVRKVDPGQALGRKTVHGVQVFVANGLDDDQRAAVVAQLGLEG